MDDDAGGEQDSIQYDIISEPGDVLEHLQHALFAIKDATHFIFNRLQEQRRHVARQLLWGGLVMQMVPAFNQPPDNFIVGSGLSYSQLHGFDEKFQSANDWHSTFMEGIDDQQQALENFGDWRELDDEGKPTAMKFVRSRKYGLRLIDLSTARFQVEFRSGNRSDVMKENNFFSQTVDAVDEFVNRFDSNRLDDNELLFDGVKSEQGMRRSLDRELLDGYVFDEDSPSQYPGLDLETFDENRVKWVSVTNLREKWLNTVRKGMGRVPVDSLTGQKLRPSIEFVNTMRFSLNLPQKRKAMKEAMARQKEGLEIAGKNAADPELPRHPDVRRRTLISPDDMYTCSLYRQTLFKVLKYGRTQQGVWVLPEADLGPLGCVHLTKELESLYHELSVPLLTGQVDEFLPNAGRPSCDRFIAAVTGLVVPRLFSTCEPWSSFLSRRSRVLGFQESHPGLVPVHMLTLFSDFIGHGKEHALSALNLKTANESSLEAEQQILDLIHSRDK